MVTEKVGMIGMSRSSSYQLQDQQYGTTL